MVRAAPPGATVIAVLVTGDPAELTPLARLALAALCGCPRLSWRQHGRACRLVYDESGALAATAGVPTVSDGTEAAVGMVASRIGARADGRGACRAAASADGPDAVGETLPPAQPEMRG
jgi:hypothetical protein